MAAWSPGLANKLVVFQNPPAQPSDAVPDPQWTNAAEAWVSIEPLSGRELLLSMQSQASITHRVKLWFMPNLDPSQRIVWGKRILDIDSVINWQERNIGLEILAQEVLDV